MNKLIDAVGGRKALLAIAVVGVALGVVFIKGDVPDGLVQILSVVFGGFMVGNGAEHIGAAMSSRKEAELTEEDGATVSVANEQVINVVEALKKLQADSEANAQAIANVQQGLSLIISKAYGLERKAQ